MVDKLFEAIAAKVANWAGQPPAFAISAIIVVVWGVTGPLFHYSDTWQLVINTGTTIVTFLMVFLIQNAQNRDGAAMQAKLDELIRALNGAREEFIGIEDLTQEQLMKVKKVLARECGGDTSHHESIARLIERI